MKNKHYDVILAWAEGKEIDIWDNLDNEWVECKTPMWRESNKYRVRPQRITYTAHFFWDVVSDQLSRCDGKPNAIMKFDGCGKLISIEKI